jgi:hypothetical protein
MRRAAGTVRRRKETLDAVARKERSTKKSTLQHQHPSSVLLYKLVETLESGHDELQSPLTVIFAGCSAIVGCHRPIRAAVYIAPIDDGNTKRPFAILGRL